MGNNHSDTFQLSYADYTGYEDSLSLYGDDYESIEHVFDVNGSFPELSEYKKFNLNDLNVGLDKSALTFDQEAMVTLKMVETNGSFKNVLGYYTVSAEGVIRNVAVAFDNTREAESGLSHSFNISGSGDSVGFFIVANGFNLNKLFDDVDLAEGNFSFIYNFGEADERLAKITDNAIDVMLVYTAKSGEIFVVKGPVYHATEGENHSHINNDSDVHVVSGLAEGSEGEILRIGFEDFPGLGDADFNDIIFDLSVSYLDNDYDPFADPATTISGVEPAGGNAGGEEDPVSGQTIIVGDTGDAGGLEPPQGTGAGAGVSTGGDVATILVGDDSDNTGKPGGSMDPPIGAGIAIVVDPSTGATSVGPINGDTDPGIASIISPPQGGGGAGPTVGGGQQTDPDPGSGIVADGGSGNNDPDPGIASLTQPADPDPGVAGLTGPQGGGTDPNPGVGLAGGSSHSDPGPNDPPIVVALAPPPPPPPVKLSPPPPPEKLSGPPQADKGFDKPPPPPSSKPPPSSGGSISPENVIAVGDQVDEAIAGFIDLGNTVTNHRQIFADRESNLDNVINTAQLDPIDDVINMNGIPISGF